jgi:hypothetical protein
MCIKVIKKAKFENREKNEEIGGLRKFKRRFIVCKDQEERRKQINNNDNERRRVEKWNIERKEIKIRKEKIMKTRRK